MAFPQSVVGAASLTCACVLYRYDPIALAADLLALGVPLPPHPPLLQAQLLAAWADVLATPPSALPLHLRSLVPLVAPRVSPLMVPSPGQSPSDVRLPTTPTTVRSVSAVGWADSMSSSHSTPSRVPR